MNSVLFHYKKHGILFKKEIILLKLTNITDKMLLWSLLN